MIINQSDRWLIISFEKNELCFIEILKSRNGAITTSEILEASDEFPDLCKDCKSGSSIVSAGLSLMKKGLVKREIAKGGFRWSLI